MKKFVSVIAAATLLAFAAPVFAATNPFMDVPMNHWAYDAIGQLAAHGILSGYPDGTYKGKQPTTRYEMASALARALAVVDMTKASKQDVEMLKKLVIEFKDELEALGVKVDDIDGRLAKIESRLGGWYIHAQLRQDIVGHDTDAVDAGTSSWSTPNSRGRLFLERWFGEDEQMHAMIRIDRGGSTNATSLDYKLFYVEMPFFFDSTLTAGRFYWEEMAPYYIDGAADIRYTGAYIAMDDYLLDRQVEGFGWSKNFAMGKFDAFVAHSDVKTGKSEWDIAAQKFEPKEYSSNNWEVYAKGELQFNEKFGLDLGVHGLMGDNNNKLDAGNNEWDFTSMWTFFGGLRFNFNENIALKGIYFHQKTKAEYVVSNVADDYDLDNANAFKVILDVKQDALKFTSLWAEYGQVNNGFVFPGGNMSDAGAVFAYAKPFNQTRVMGDDLKYWRVALGQKWTDKWATHLFYFGYNFDNNDNIKEWGLGVEYRYNPSVKFGLNFMRVDYDESWENAGKHDDNLIRFRTQVTF